MECIGTEFKSYLVIPFAGGTVCDILSIFLSNHLDHGSEAQRRIYRGYSNFCHEYEFYFISWSEKII